MSVCWEQGCERTDGLVEYVFDRATNTQHYLCERHVWRKSGARARKAPVGRDLALRWGDRRLATKVADVLSIEVAGLRVETYEEHVMAWHHLDGVEDDINWFRGALAASVGKRYGEDRLGRFAAEVGRSRRAVEFYRATFEAFDGNRKRFRFSTLKWSHFHKLLELGAPEEEHDDLLQWAEARPHKNGLTRTARVRELEAEIRHRRMRRELEDAPPAEPLAGAWKPDHVYVADISDVRLPSESVDAIFTDPPYGDVGAYEKLARLAAHCLRPGAFCLAYAPKMYLPDVVSILGSDLEYVWLLAALQPGNNERAWTQQFFEAHRPILVFKKAGESEWREWVADAVRSPQEKAHHDHQQPEAEARLWIPAFCRPAGLVLDPFCGGGTTAAACRAIGRHFLAFDRDPDAVRIALKRLKVAV